MVPFNRYEEAEKDCTQAIFLDGSYSKAFARRGTARTFLGKLVEAKQGTAFITALTHPHETPKLRGIYIAFPCYAFTVCLI